MKKALVLLLAFALVAAAFAEDIVYKTAPSISGNGEVKWGVNFNDNATGFKNSTTAEVNFPLVAKTTSTHTGDAIYGEVSIADIELDFGKDATTSQGSATAKIILPNSMYITIAGKPGYGINNAVPYSTYANDGWGDSVLWSAAYGGAAAKDSLVKVDWAQQTGGIAFGMTGDFNFALKVSSVNAYDAAIPAAGEDPNNDENVYGFGADVGYKVPDLLTVSASGFYGPTDPETPASNQVGFGVKVNVAPVDTGLVLNIGLDGVNTTVGAAAAVMGMDLAADVAYTLTDIVTVSLNTYYGDANTTTDGALLDAGARLSLLAVPDLTAEVGVDLWDLMADPAQDPMLVFVGGKVSYKIMQGDANYIKPFGEVSYALDDANLAVVAGVEAVLFPQGTLTAKYAAGGNTPNTVQQTNNAFDDDMGTFTLGCKIVY